MEDVILTKVDKTLSSLRKPHTSLYPFYGCRFYVFLLSEATHSLMSAQDLIHTRWHVMEISSLTRSLRSLRESFSLKC